MKRRLIRMLPADKAALAESANPLHRVLGALGLELASLRAWRGRDRVTVRLVYRDRAQNASLVLTRQVREVP
jgi:hypothetical protein